MYENGLTTGVSATKFDSSSLMSGNAYGTFVLRALGYDDTKGDFTRDTSLELLASKGVLSESENVFMSGTFRRNEMVGLSYNALSAKLKDSNMTLEESLGLVDNRLFARDEDLLGTVTAKYSGMGDWYQVDGNELSKLVGDVVTITSSITDNNDNLDSHISRLFVSEKDKEKYRGWYEAYPEYNLFFDFQRNVCIVIPILDTNFDVNYYMYLDSRVQQGIDDADVEVNVYKMSDEISDMINTAHEIYNVEYVRLREELIEYDIDQFEVNIVMTKNEFTGQYFERQALEILDEDLKNRARYYSSGNIRWYPDADLGEYIVDTYLIHTKIGGNTPGGYDEIENLTKRSVDRDGFKFLILFYDINGDLIGYTLMDED